MGELRPTVEQSPPAGETCGALPRTGQARATKRLTGPGCPIDLLVIHDDRGLNAPLLAELVVKDLDDLRSATVEKPDRIALAEGLRVPTHDSDYRAGCIDEP